MFDASNWNVNFSGTQSNLSTSGQKASTGTPPALKALTGISSGYVWAAVAIVAAAVLYKKLG